MMIVSGEGEEMNCWPAFMADNINFLLALPDPLAASQHRQVFSIAFGVSDLASLIRIS